MGRTKNDFLELRAIQEENGWTRIEKAMAVTRKRPAKKKASGGPAKQDGTVDWEKVPGYDGLIPEVAWQIGNHALQAGYQVARRNEWNLVLKKQDPEHGAVTFNFYWNKHGHYTVQTTVDHPKAGRSQMNRKGLGIEDVRRLLINPRKHTGKGYRKKNNKK